MNVDAVVSGNNVDVVAVDSVGSNDVDVEVNNVVLVSGNSVVVGARQRRRPPPNF